jgi:hypothetical protein
VIGITTCCDAVGEQQYTPDGFAIQGHHEKEVDFAGVLLFGMMSDSVTP